MVEYHLSHSLREYCSDLVFVLHGAFWGTVFHCVLAGLEITDICMLWPFDC